jgi:hypothetical protein
LDIPRAFWSDNCACIARCSNVQKRSKTEFVGTVIPDRSLSRLDKGVGLLTLLEFLSFPKHLESLCLSTITLQLMMWLSPLFVHWLSIPSAKRTLDIQVWYLHIIQADGLTTNGFSGAPMGLAPAAHILFSRYKLMIPRDVNKLISVLFT